LFLVGQFLKIFSFETALPNAPLHDKKHLWIVLYEVCPSFKWIPLIVVEKWTLTKNLTNPDVAADAEVTTIAQLFSSKSRAINGALHSQPQMIKFASCFPMVGGSLRVLRLPPPLKLVVMI
jgi:hypothetical protein